MKVLYSFIHPINIGCHCVRGSVHHAKEHKTLKTQTKALPPPGILDSCVVRQMTNKIFTMIDDNNLY